MGSSSECMRNCWDGEDPTIVKVYGDYFNAETRSVLNILEISGLKPKLVAIDTTKDKNGKVSASRESYAKDINVADAIPMLYHDGSKIMSDMEHILKYLKGKFPEVSS